MPERGKFIVFEGLDKSGKSTACRALTDTLNKFRHAELISFPNRSSPTGKLINEYLSRKDSTLPPEAIHLLFSANRWEMQKDIKDKLEKGVDVVCDRYYHSGIAYSYANGVDMEWACHADEGLLQPDLIIYLDSSAETLAKREGYGGEVFERLEFQKAVREGFVLLLNGHDLMGRVGVEGLSIEECNRQVECLVRKRLDIV